jgi:hypothetical protein
MLFGRVLQRRRRIRRWRRDNSTGSLQLDQLKPDYGALSMGTTPTFAGTVSGNTADYRVQVDTTEAFSSSFVINTTDLRTEVTSLVIETVDAHSFPNHTKFRPVEYITFEPLSVSL